MTKYFPISLRGWGDEVDYNVFLDEVGLVSDQKEGTDEHSIFGNPQFVNLVIGNLVYKKLHLRQLLKHLLFQK